MSEEVCREHHDRLADLGTLAASVAHEFNNLLTPAAGWAQVGRRALANQTPTAAELDVARRALDSCARAAGRAATLAETILGHARPSQPFEAVDVASAVQSAIDLAMADDVKVDVEPGVAVVGSQVGVEHVLLNLLLNARRAVEPAPPLRRAIVVHGRRVGDRAVIEVNDRGVGIAVDAVARVFDDFRHGFAGGSGLGLGLCRRLVQRMHGTIEVASTPGVGSTFRVTLPLAQAAARASAA